MARYAVETRSTEPKNFFAGDFPTLPETGTAGEKLAEHTPVTVNEAGEIVAVAAATTGDVVGVTAEAAEKALRLPFLKSTSTLFVTKVSS